MRALTIEQQKQVVALYSQGHTCAQIASKLLVGMGYVYECLGLNKVKPRGRPIARPALGSAMARAHCAGMTKISLFRLSKGLCYSAVCNYAKTLQGPNKRANRPLHMALIAVGEGALHSDITDVFGGDVFEEAKKASLEVLGPMTSFIPPRCPMKHHGKRLETREQIIRIHMAGLSNNELAAMSKRKINSNYLNPWGCDKETQGDVDLSDYSRALLLAFVCGVTFRDILIITEKTAEEIHADLAAMGFKFIGGEDG